MRKWMIWLSLGILLICSLGCSEVQLSPRYQRVLEASAINVRGMLKDCQEGSQVSCEEGLAEAARTLDLFLDASYGRESD